MRFKVNCDPRWQPLAQAVEQESGEVLNQMERDGQVTVDLLLGVQLTLTGDIDAREVLPVHGLERLTQSVQWITHFTGSPSLVSKTSAC